MGVANEHKVPLLQVGGSGTIKSVWLRSVGQARPGQQLGTPEEDAHRVSFSFIDVVVNPLNSSRPSQPHVLQQWGVGSVGGTCPRSLVWQEGHQTSADSAL